MALNDGLRAYWKLEETAGNRVDAVTGLLVAQIGAGVFYGTGILNTGIAGTATGVYSRLLSPTVITDDSFSVSFWFRATNVTNAQYLVAKGNLTLDHSWSFYFSAGSLSFRVVDNGSFVHTVSTTVVANTWYHILGTRADGGTMTLYKNGVLAGTPTNSGSTDVLGADHAFGFGGDPTSGALAIRTGTIIDEVAFWNQVQPATAAAELFNNGNGNFYDNDFVDSFDSKPPPSGVLGGFSVSEVARTGSCYTLAKGAVLEALRTQGHIPANSHMGDIATFTNGSTTVNFTNASASHIDWGLIDSAGGVYQVKGAVASTSFSLDRSYTGATGSKQFHIFEFKPNSIPLFNPHLTVVG